MSTCNPLSRNTFVGTMAYHPSGVVIDILGTEDPSMGRSCEQHDICGSVLQLDTVVRLRSAQVMVDGQEKTVIEALWVTDGIDCCRVGFLPKRCVKDRGAYECQLCQIIEILDGESESASDRRLAKEHNGVCRAAIITPFSLK